MHNVKKKAIVHNVYFKVSLIILFSWLLILFFGAVIFRITVQELAGEPKFKKIIAHCCSLAVADIESGDIREKIDWYARTLNIGITVYEGQSAYSTEEGYPPLEVFAKHGPTVDDNPVFATHRMNHVVEKNGRVYVFYHDRSGSFGRFFMAALAFSAALVLTGALLVFRKMLRPLRLLQEGMNRISGGEIEHRVPVTSGDEFGQLAAAFNSMNESLVKMMRAKERIVLDISHEFKSPLARIMLALEMDDIDKIRSSVGSDAMHLSSMISGILDKYRSSANIKLSLSQADIGKLINDVLLREKNAERVRFAGTTNVVRCDPDRVSILLRNIIENALFYSRDEVLITVETRDIAFAGRRTSRAVHETVLSVCDKGGGIPPAELPYIFEPFYRVDRSRTASTGGTGLGLFICKSIVDAHGWKIDIDSKAGGGTCVRLIIPAES